MISILRMRKFKLKDRDFPKFYKGESGNARSKPRLPNSTAHAPRNGIISPLITSKLIKHKKHN